MNVFFAPGAREDIALSQAWWREHRPDAPELMADTLRDAFVGLAERAKVLPRYRAVGGLEVRRLHLSRVHRHVYVRVLPTGDVVVLAVWGAVRGLLPQLRVRAREAP